MTFRFQLMACLSLWSFAVVNAVDEDGVVRMLVTRQEYDCFQPWQKSAPTQASGYAFSVGGGRFVSTETLLRNHTLVELQRVRSGTKLRAVVELTDPQVNLALLRLDAAAETAFPELALAERLERGDSVSILQFDDTLELQRLDARAVQVLVERLPHAPYSTLTFRLLVDINVSGEGAPVVSSEGLAGLIFKYDGNARIASMIPHPVIRAFLDDARHAPYRGVASAGFTWTPLVDPATRRHLGAPSEDEGVLLLSVLPGTGAEGVLKSGDVILSCEGFAIDNLGFYQDPDFGRLAFPHIVKARRRPGDSVTFRVVRGRTQQTADVRLQRWRDELALIPENVEGRRPPYLVEGGLILREVSGRYLRAHGNDWTRRVDLHLVREYLTRSRQPDFSGERVVILQGVLPHEINVGYQEFRNQVVTAVNGAPVTNLMDVFRSVEEHGHLRSLRLRSMGVDLVLDEREIATANRRLALTYGITEPQYGHTQ